MARTDLTRLLGNVGDQRATGTHDSPDENAVDDSSPISAPKRAQSNTGAASVPAKRKPAVSKPSPKVEPSATYLRFVRKETRLRDDQQNALTQHARRLSRARTQPGPRITDNTLIRVAVDLLLTRIEKASGDDEAAILESLNQ